MFDPILSGLMPAPRKPRASREQLLTHGDRARARRALEDLNGFIDSSEFRRKGAAERIFDRAPEVARADVSWYRPLVEDLSAHTNRDAKRQSTAPLTGAQECVLFLQLNFARYRLSLLHIRLAGRVMRAAEVREVLLWADRAEMVRTQLAEANIALVLAMARRVRADDLEFADLIGEGNMALMRSVDKFDCGRGFKFSTYACRSILKAFSRAGIKGTKYRQRFPVVFDPEMEMGNRQAVMRDVAQSDSAAELKMILNNNRANLSAVEQEVIEHRFGFNNGLQSDTPTLEEIGNRLGLTKERVRQLQNRALEKFRATLSARALTSARVPQQN
ncbi:MAG: sigma-70 family RNA polymerase sigma factor [Planctomycetota bacterium]|nr:sigma-70 family RNA polymerase sigma factor [Planctomycetota bacterium]